MTTTENNKIIAQFLEISHQKRAMNFHSNWNILIDVVEKIEDLGYTFSIKLNWVKINKKHNKDNFIVVRWEEDKTKIEAVYNGCVEFIKFYNEQKNYNNKHYKDLI